MIKFKKVSYKQFEKDCLALGYTPTKELYNSIKLPKKSSTKSSIYNFYTPFKIQLGFKKTQFIPTGITVSLDRTKLLILFPNLTLENKTGMHLSNNFKVLDSTSNGEHLIIETISGFDKCDVEPNEKFMQGIIVEGY